MARARTRLRVVFVNRYFHPDLSATSQMLTRVAVALARRGFDVHVVCSRQLYERADASLPRGDDHAGVRIHRVRGTSFGRAGVAGRLADYLSFHAGAALALWRLLRRDDVVVAKTDPPMVSVTAMVAAQLRGASLVNWLQDLFPEVATRLGVGRLPGFVESTLLWLRDRSLGAATSNVVLGERMAEYLVGRGLPRGGLRVIPNTADATAAPPTTGQSALRARVCPGPAFVVAYSGNLGRAHDVVALSGAIERLRDDPAFRFLMIGGGDGMRRLQREALERGWHNVAFLPYQDDAALADSLAAADVHLVSLLPALEGLILPSKVYGILAAARPLVFIGAADGEIARLVREARCGAVVADGDGAALAQALRALRDDELALARMGREARKTYLQRFAPARVVAAWVDLLGGMASESQGPVNPGRAARERAALPPRTAPASRPPAARRSRDPASR